MWSAAGPRLTGVGIPGDGLYPKDVVKRWVEDAGATYAELASSHGHDGFLLEAEAAGALLAGALERRAVEGPPADHSLRCAVRR